MDIASLAAKPQKKAKTLMYRPINSSLTRNLEELKKTTDLPIEVIEKLTKLTNEEEISFHLGHIKKLGNLSHFNFRRQLITSKIIKQ
jgi:hypothetical protein